MLERDYTKMNANIYTYILTTLLGSVLIPLTEERKLSQKFSKKWGEKEEQQASFGKKVKKAFHPATPLKPQLDYAVKRMEAQIQRMDQTGDRFLERDKSMFAKIVEAYSRHDLQHANVLANELAEIRKMEKTVINARLALEQIALRLRTVTELSGMVSTLAPAVGVLRNIRTAISGVLPYAGKELEQIGTILGGIVMDAGQTTGLSLNFEASNSDAQKILTEAATIAEQRIKEKFPELPAGVHAASDKTQTQN
jgi:division protein CdvB (Snf7/Vps24/ESCRT-III family)